MQGAGRVYLCSSGKSAEEEGRLPGKRENTKVDEMLIYEIIALMAFGDPSRIIYIWQLKLDE